MQKKINTVKAFGISARGRSEMLKYLSGKKITRQQAINAQCYECNGYQRQDCMARECVLWPYSPYAKEAFDD